VTFMREETELNIPVVAFVAHPSDSEFKRAFASGADDALVEGDALAIVQRLHCMAGLDAMARPSAHNGLALVAAPDLSKRRHIGRTLRQVGFDVAFAAEARELVSLSRMSNPALVVATPSFPPMGGAAAVRSVRTATQKPDLPALVIGDGARTSSQHDIGVRGELLFLAEEFLTPRDASELRRSKRLLYATICAFRRSGTMEPAYGLTYNLSREGLYVQTLDPPTPGTRIWLELRTPDDAAVHVRGIAMWRREASQIGSAPPPGFGVKLEQSQCPPMDFAKYVVGYDRLLADYDAIN
jgi:CheY-like chemotaxis protein